MAALARCATTTPAVFRCVRYGWPRTCRTYATNSTSSAMDSWYDGVCRNMSDVNAMRNLRAVMMPSQYHLPGTKW